VFGDVELRWTEACDRWVEEKLKALHGRRVARRLTLAQVRATAQAALATPHRYAVIHGGDVDDARQHTSLCLAVARDDGVVVGLGVSRTQGASPVRVFADIATWDRFREMANVVEAERWARREADDRTLVSFEASKEASLLASILDHPFDEAARQVYADWLIERGDARGEFIAVQNELALGRVDEERRAQLLSREQALLDANAPRWLKGVSESDLRVSFANGFVDAVTVLDAEGLFSAASTFDREPLRQVVVKTSRTLDVSRFLALGFVSRLSSLELVVSEAGSACLTRSGFAALCATRRLRRLTSLGLVGQDIGDEGAAILAREGPHAFPNLTRLQIIGDRLTAAAIRQLGRTRWFTGLSSLMLDENTLGPEGASELADVRFRRLVHLSLGGNRIGSDGALALSSSSALSRLTGLWLHSNGIGAMGAQAISSSPSLAGLQRLILDANPIGKRMRQVIAERLASANGGPH
jgi:uncharacterized protein (TIGR02996 family)